MKATPEALRRFLREGGWFCEHCERVVVLSLDCDSPARCPRCHKPCAIWHPPVYHDPQPATSHL